jgi:hypothetical protein
MGKRRAVILSVVSVLVVAALVSPAFGQQTIEGTVISTTLTACELKPGTCEGSLVLETRTAGKPGQVTIKVPKGVLIKQGNDSLFLPGTKGRLVAITYVEAKGEKLARSIEVKTSKP